MIQNILAARRKVALETSPQLTLGELIQKLESLVDKSKQVRFDFEYAYPCGLSSWRGAYDELAIEFRFDGENPTVERFISDLRSAVGKKYTGWKGGEFTMTKDTPVWVANSGNSGNTAVVGVLDSWCVILQTQFCEY